MNNRLTVLTQLIAGAFDMSNNEMYEYLEMDEEDLRMLKDKTYERDAVLSNRGI